MKIIITLLVLISLGIVVGSNLLPTMTVVILNQPTVALPIGVWLTIAIGSGVLSSILIQSLTFLDRRLLKRQVRQLQSRLQQQDEDVFTYTSSASGSDSSSRDKPIDADSGNVNPVQTATNRFRSYRSNLADRFVRKPSTQRSVIDDDSDDWEAEPVSTRQLDWENSSSPSQQNIQSPPNRATIQTEQIYADRNSQKIATGARQTSREVYDAEFRLIQPPYKEPLATEFDEDRESEDFEYPEVDEDFDLPSSSVKPTSPNRSTPSSNLDDEDWGFDFDDRDPPVRAN